MPLFRCKKSDDHYLQCLTRLKNNCSSDEGLWNYIENTFKQMSSAEEIKNFINVYHNVFGIDYRFFHTNISFLDKEMCDYDDLLYLGNIIHIAYAAKNEFALQYVFGHFNQPKLFEVVEKTSSITEIKSEADTLPQQLMPKYIKISYLMGFHKRLGENSTLFAAANDSLGKKAFENDMTKQIFSYLSM
jgi:hypothetical protein